MFVRYARRAADLYILVMLGVFPLWCGVHAHAYTAITRTKYEFFLIATLVWLGCTAVLLAAALIRRECRMPAIRPAHLAMGLFLVCGAFSAAVSAYGSVCLLGAGRYDGFLTTVLYAAVFFGVSFLGEPKRCHVWAAGISTLLCCIVAVLQLFGLDPFSLYPEGMNYYDKYERLSAAFLGTIGNAGILTAFLTLTAPLLVCFAVLSRRRADRFLLIPGVLAAAVLLLCDVDAGVAALLGCVLVSVPTVIRRKRASCLAGAVSGGVLLAGVSALYLLPFSSGTAGELRQVLHGTLADEFGSHRGQIWKRCLALFRERPWLGGGPGTISLRLDIRWSRYIEALGKERSVFVDNAHNVFLGHLVNIGLPGALCYLAALVCSLATWQRRRTEGALYPALGCALVCCMIQEFFGLGLVISEPMLFIVWGLLESAGTSTGPVGRHELPCRA